MIYRDFQDIKLSQLGFGTMRMPVKNTETGELDQEQINEMVRIAAENGVNYFDTAYPYQGGLSELAIGEALKQLPRDSFYLATKFPGHQVCSNYDPSIVFEDQLDKCQVDYFDFYLLHNVYENSLSTYEDEKWGIIDYFVEQKKLGRIKHLGFSTHALVGFMEEFLEKYGDIMEFCQIQVNYLDWTLQDAKAKCQLLNKYNIPIFVMEPVRGGKLANLGDAENQRLKELRPEDSIASWAFRFLQDIEGVTMILSGMSNIDQMVDNCKTFKEEKALSEEERNTLLDFAEGMKKSVPCTACRYCTDGCPMGLDIPNLLALYNDVAFSPNFNVGMIINALSEDKKPAACIACGACAAVCPQKIDIPEALSDFAAKLKELPDWNKMSKEREDAAIALRESRKKN